jgi:uncharacterized protein DUF5666
MMRHCTPNHIVLLLALTLGLAPLRASGGPPATFENLKVGQVVSVDGTPAGARAVLARIIEIEAGPQDDKVKGQIDAISTGDKSLTVLGVKVVAGPGARILDRDGRPLSLSGLQKGWVVKARGQLRTDGTLHATEIKVSKPAADKVGVQGKIQALDTSRRTLTVIGLTIRVTPATTITLN